MRYREKRKNKKFEKTIRYASREAYSETRPKEEDTMEIVTQVKMVKVVVVLNISEGVSRTVHFSQQGDGPTTVVGNLSGLKLGLHGFHVHALEPMVACPQVLSYNDHISILLEKSMVLQKTSIAILMIWEM